MSDRMVNMSEKIILASQSPRRSELLSLITTDFEVITADVDETVDENETAENTVMALSKKKADVVSSLYPGRTVIGADTIVVCDGKILGKPVNRNHAIEMLRSLSGRTHQVLTGVTITDSYKTETFFVSSDVTFFELNYDEICAYAQSGEPDDKAGAYGIQGKGSLLVEKISGDYFNIVGLPVSMLNKKLKDF